MSFLLPTENASMKEKSIVWVIMSWFQIQKPVIPSRLSTVMLLPWCLCMKWVRFLLNFFRTAPQSNIFSESNKRDPYRAQVQWYSRLEQLPKKKRPLNEASINPPLNESWELIHEGKMFKGDISLETIFNKCSILHCDVSKTPNEIGKQNKTWIFFCRFELGSRFWFCDPSVLMFNFNEFLTSFLLQHPRDSLYLSRDQRTNQQVMQSYSQLRKNQRKRILLKKRATKPLERGDLYEQHLPGILIMSNFPAHWRTPNSVQQNPRKICA